MQKLFNKILIPVDFSANSKIAVEKAIDVAKLYGCSIHLVHAVPISAFSQVSLPGGHMSIPYNVAIDNKKELEYRLKKIAGYISLHSDGIIKVDYSVTIGTWDYVIIDLIQQEKFDLVLIGQKGSLIGKRKMAMNPDTIASKANVPVLTVPSNRRLTRLYSIIIPVTDFLPVRKLMYGIYIASNYETTIKLLGIENRVTKSKVQLYLKKSYQLIHDNSNVKVEVDTVAGENAALAINEFAMLNSADLVIVNPGTQTKMPGFFSLWLGKILQKYSAPPVLTVNAI